MMDKTDSTFQTGEIGILNDNCDSEIQKFYAGKNILLTGSIGFLGTLILEKLLRSCTGISKIYVLLRPKNGISIEERIKRRFEDVVSTSQNTSTYTNYNNRIPCVSNNDTWREHCMKIVSRFVLTLCGLRAHTYVYVSIPVADEPIYVV